MKAPHPSYQKVLLKIGKGLGLQGRISEDAIIVHCLQQIDVMVKKSGAIVANLEQLRDLVALQLNLTIQEIRQPEDIKSLLKKYPPAAEPVMARIPIELDDRTDAIVIHRPNCEAWDRPYLAVINCMGSHFHKRYFSKWHEIVHLLLEGRQTTFAFRRTHESEKKEPLEQLVDRVAGQLAFYSPLFRPVFEAASSTGLTFATIEAVRAKTAPEASRQAATLACVRHSTEPVLYLRLKMGFTKSEHKELVEPDLFPDTKIAPEPKLRVQDSASNEAAQKIGLQMFPNMSISGESLAGRAFTKGAAVQGQENFSLWREGAPLIRVAVEVMKVGQELHCLLQAR